MSKKISILSNKNICLYSDALQDLMFVDKKDKSIFIEMYNPQNFSFATCSHKKNNSTLMIEINREDFENICKEYLNYIKEKS